jgi:hypothetical protein
LLVLKKEQEKKAREQKKKIVLIGCKGKESQKSLALKKGAK